MTDRGGLADGPVVTDRAGIVLAGGFARRFDDRDKTLAELDGRPLIAHAVESMAASVDTVVVSCREEQITAFEGVLDAVQFCPDPTPDQGPLAGLAAALAAVDADQVAITTADRPCVTSGLYRALFDALEGDGVVIRDGGIRQPAPAVFRTQPLREVVVAQRDAGEDRLRAIFDHLDIQILSAEPLRDQWSENLLADVNTPAALAALQGKHRSE